MRGSTMTVALTLPLLMHAVAVDAQRSPAVSSPVPAASVPPPPDDPTFVNDAFTGKQIRYESVNRGEPGGDRLADPRRIAAAVIAADRPGARLIVDVGSHAGEFLEAFLDQFPAAKAQWTEPVTDNNDNARRRFARFHAGRVAYVVGCPDRDLSLGCVPAGVDVLITSWLTIHQDLAGIRRFYVDAARLLPAGGWVANMDHVAMPGPWPGRMQTARATLKAEGVASLVEGPRVHHLDYVLPTLEDQLAALRAAGFADPQVVWRRLDTVMIVARKP